MKFVTCWSLDKNQNNILIFLARKYPKNFTVEKISKKTKEVKKNSNIFQRKSHSSNIFNEGKYKREFYVSIDTFFYSQTSNFLVSVILDHCLVRFNNQISNCNYNR